MEKRKICVIGLGYIGLPTAAIFATHGFEVVGVDINQDIVAELNLGRRSINEPDLDVLVRNAVESGSLTGSSVPEKADAFIIAVPTPVDEFKRADMSCVISAARSIVPYMRQGSIVILESTSPVGSVEDILLPILAGSGLEAGREFFAAYCPERVLPGRILKELVENNRIIGGINEESSIAARSLYESFVKGEILLTDVRTAEMCKLTENIFRDVNIALANELATICERAGINVWNLIGLCNRHPRVNIHMPGPGVGGHCIAIDPWFVVDKYPEEAGLIAMSRKINDHMPRYVYERIEGFLGDIEGKKIVTVLGATYKADVDDTRESPVLKLAELLEAGGYEARIADRHAAKLCYGDGNVYSALEGSDLLVLGVGHSCFKDIDFKSVAGLMRNKRIFDTRNFLDAELLTSLGFNYCLLGEGTD